MIRRIISLIVFGIVVLNFGVSQERIPRNIIVMIGDGMGIAQVTAGRTSKGTLELEQFKTGGFLLTHPYGDEYITDSAAGATALATGVTTYNGAIGVGPDTVARKTALEQAQRKGKKTGVIAVCSITHATPASFVAHVPQRSMELEIAKQISESRTDLYLGSGWGWFLPKSQGGRRVDGLDLVQGMRAKGFAYISTYSDFTNLDLEQSERVLGLFAENHVGTAQERKPSLMEMTRIALQFLSESEKGFFLVVEGSQIDWASHDRNSDQVAVEMADFDDAIGEALRFSKKHPETLIIVTADHETGGYSLTDGSLKKKTVVGTFTTGDHTGAMVPLFATGPGAERFGGIQPNANVGKILLDILK